MQFDQLGIDCHVNLRGLYIIHGKSTWQLSLFLKAKSISLINSERELILATNPIWYYDYAIFDMKVRFLRT